MDWAELFTATNLVIGTLVLVVSTGAGLITWFYRRVRHIAKEVNPIDLETASKVQHIERQVGQMSDTMVAIDGRVSLMERRMESVATQKDISELRQETAALSTGQRYMSGMLDTIYQAAINASSPRGDKT